MSESTKKNTKIPGLRYREHSIRKHGMQKDRYFFIRYTVDGKRKEEGLGWLSEGWTEKKAAARLFELKENNRTGIGHKTLAEKREAAKKLEEIVEQERQKRALFRDVFYQYTERVKKDESEKSYTRKLGLFQKWINPIFQDIELESIKPTLVETVKDNMASNGQSERSIQYALSTITLVFKYAKSIELTERDIPTSKVRTPQER
jgi:hypothetical protein